MKNGIYISLLSLGLIACGGDSDSESPSINESFAAGIKGQQIQPALTTGEISEGDSAVLNTTYTGTVEEDGYTSFNFTLDEDTQVALVLSSGATDLDLHVSGTGVQLYSDLNNSNELIVFDAIATQSYTVRVESFEGSGEFQLKFVEANRSSAGLGAEEYLLRFAVDATQTCSTDGGPEHTQEYTSSFDLIVNWNAGYVDDVAGTSRESFTSVTGNTFVVNSNYSDSGSDWSESGQTTSTITTDFSTGSITGTIVESGVYVEYGETETCNWTSALTGKVLL